MVLKCLVMYQTGSVHVLALGLGLGFRVTDRLTLIRWRDRLSAPMVSVIVRDRVAVKVTQCRIKTTLPSPHTTRTVLEIGLGYLP